MKKLDLRGAESTRCVWKYQLYNVQTDKELLHLELLFQVGIGSHRALHHVWGDREVLWQLLASLDHSWVGAIHTLVAKKPVLLPMVHAVL